MYATLLTMVSSLSDSINSIESTPLSYKRIQKSVKKCFSFWWSIQSFFQACKWSNYKIPLSAQNKEWFVYVDPSATYELLEELTEEFLTIYQQCPSRLKRKIKASTQAVSSTCLPLPKSVRMTIFVNREKLEKHVGWYSQKFSRTSYDCFKCVLMLTSLPPQLCS